MNTKPKTIEAQDPSQSGIWWVYYIVVSYPANWLFIKFCWAPFIASDWAGRLQTVMSREEKAFFLFASPIALPIEIFLIVFYWVCSVFQYLVSFM